MKLEAVVTCVDYADFLAATLPTNRSLFDQMVVVTAPDDEDTQRLCEYWNVRCVRSARFNTQWGGFDKAAGINAGLEALRLDDWVLHLDADILLPPLTRSLLERVQLDTHGIYGVDRHIVAGERELANHLFEPRLQQENDVYVHLDPFPLSPRISMAKHGGYLPIGYFQLWHPVGSGVNRYPQVEKVNGNTTDVLHAKQWARGNRHLIPELAAYHLESEPVPQGANWDGRTTRAFGEGCHHHRRRRHRHHHHHHHHDYDDGEGTA